VSAGPPRRRLVVTADDVGLAAGMTRGALRAAERGVVTAVSVAAVGEDCAAAIAELLRRPQLDAGCHLTLVGERPLSPAAEVRSLLGRDERLLPGFAAFALRHARGGVRREEVERELGRQVARLRDGGLRLTHLDSHQHLHVLPGVLECVLRLAAEHAIPFVRLPADPDLGWAATPRRAALRALGRLAGRARRRLPGAVSALDCVLGLRHAGHLTGRRLRAAVLAGAGAGIGSGELVCHELVCHPGDGDAALAARYRWGYRWERERDALCDPELPAWLSAQGVELTSFSRLAAQRPVH
jgi:chitin disaccharide deacetylase